MRRLAVSLQDLAMRENLLAATWKAARGKHQRRPVARFLADLDGNLNRLAEAILEERAPIGRFRRFTIHDPKRRVITAACFADRVLHHAILNVAEPRFERALVASSFACRPAMGVHAAVEGVQRHLRRWPWFVKVDVDAYFPSIDHARLKVLLSRRFKGQAFLALLSRIMASGAPSAGKGLPIGALTSQHFANAYLDGADRWLLGHADVRAHVRYMDDIVWWCPSREAAVSTLRGLRTVMRRELALELKPAALIGRSRSGLAFCGFRVRPGVVLASSRKLSRYRRGLVRITCAAAEADGSPRDVQRAVDTLVATLAGAQTTEFRQRLLGPASDPFDEAE